MNHPVKKVRGKAFWFGPEVEGYLQNVPTAFVTRALVAEEWDRVLASDARQLFLTEDFHDWRWLKKVWKQISSRMVVTKACYPNEVRRLRKMLVGVRLFVRVHAPWALDLNDSDQISLGMPYDLVSLKRGDGYRTMPVDYESDHT